MASVRSVIELVITGSTRGLNAASAEARRMAERVAAAEDRVSEARRRSADAESRVADVEARLAGARAQHQAALSQIGVAETRLEQVRAANAGSVSRLGQAEQDLATLRASGTATAAQIADAEQRVTDVRQEADTANRNLQQAEAQLERARGNAAQRAGNIAALEERLARARGQAFRASEDLARAETRLGVIQRRGTDDINRQRGGILGLFDAFGRLGQAFSGADGASTSLLAKLGALNSVITSIGGPIVQAVVGLAEMAAVMGLIIQIVGVLGGLIGQALAGLPALLLAIGAAAGTVALGMDGIKKAAEVIAPAFEKLKRDVSEVFVRQLTPAFRDVAAALPKVTDGFRFIAVALSGIAQQVIGFVTSARGIEVINGILRGTATLLSSMAPGIRTFVQGLLEAANVGKTAFAALGTALGSIVGRIGEVFTRLAGDGTIARAVQGLAATLTGLGAIIAPLIELFIRMGAALGTSLGQALTSIGAGIQQAIPFFEDLARVAGQVLVEAFRQLGPPLEELAKSILPGASDGLRGYGEIATNVVIPAIRDFINFLRTDGIPGLVAFTRGAIVQGLEFAKGMISAADTVLAAFQTLFTTLALIPSPFQKQFAEMAAATSAARAELDKTKATLNSIESKVIAFTVQVPSDRTTGEQGVLGVAAAMNNVQPKTVDTTVNVPSGPLVGEQGILGVAAAQAQVQNKTVTTTANVPSGPTTGTLGNQVLTGAIGAVLDKTTVTTTSVPSGPTTGTVGNETLRAAIDTVKDKTTTTKTNVIGRGEVDGLKGAIDVLKDKTVTVTVQVKGAGAIPKFAAGGRVPTSGAFLVGEKGPELLSLDALGGIVTPAMRTKQLLNARRGRIATSTDTGQIASSEQPITVNVMLSQEQIAGIAQVEIQRRDRATKRSVLAGAGVTF